MKVSKKKKILVALFFVSTMIFLGFIFENKIVYGGSGDGGGGSQSVDGCKVGWRFNAKVCGGKQKGYGGVSWHVFKTTKKTKDPKNSLYKGKMQPRYNTTRAPLGSTVGKDIAGYDYKLVKECPYRRFKYYLAFVYDGWYMDNNRPKNSTIKNPTFWGPAAVKTKNAMTPEYNTVGNKEIFKGVKTVTQIDSGFKSKTDLHIWRVGKSKTGGQAKTLFNRWRTYNSKPTKNAIPGETGYFCLIENTTLILKAITEDGQVIKEIDQRTVQTGREALVSVRGNEKIGDYEFIPGEFLDSSKKKIMSAEKIDMDAINIKNDMNHYREIIDDGYAFKQVLREPTTVVYAVYRGNPIDPPDTEEDDCGKWKPSGYSSEASDSSSASGQTTSLSKVKVSDTNSQYSQWTDGASGGVVYAKTTDRVQWIHCYYPGAQVVVPHLNDEVTVYGTHYPERERYVGDNNSYKLSNVPFSTYWTEENKKQDSNNYDMKASNRGDQRATSFDPVGERNNEKRLFDYNTNLGLGNANLSMEKSLYGYHIKEEWKIGDDDYEKKLQGKEGAILRETMEGHGISSAEWTNNGSHSWYCNDGTRYNTVCHDVEKTDEDGNIIKTKECETYSYPYKIYCSHSQRYIYYSIDNSNPSPTYAEVYVPYNYVNVPKVFDKEPEAFSHHAEEGFTEPSEEDEEDDEGDNGDDVSEEGDNIDDDDDDGYGDGSGSASGADSGDSDEGGETEESGNETGDDTNDGTVNEDDDGLNELVDAGQKKTIYMGIATKTRENRILGGEYATMVRDAQWKLRICYTDDNVTLGSPNSGNELSDYDRDKVEEVDGSKNSKDFGSDTSAFIEGECVDTEPHVSALNEESVEFGDIKVEPFDIAMPDIKAGSTVCIKALVYPYGVDDDKDMDADGNKKWGISKEGVCYTIKKNPTIQVWGGNVSTKNVNIDTGETIMEKNQLQGYDAIYYGGGKNYDPKQIRATQYFGSWGELGVISGNSGVSGFASGAALGYGGIFNDGTLPPYSPNLDNTNGNNTKNILEQGNKPGGATDESFCNWSLLTIANNDCDNTSRTAGGMDDMSGIEQIGKDKDAVKERFMPDNETRSLLAGNSLGVEDVVEGGYVYSMTDLTITNGSVDKGVRTIHVMGNITIDGNIEYNKNVQYEDLSDIPKVIIYAEGGDINIKCDVKQVDAVLIADDIVDTCYDAPDNKNGSERSNQLIINGAVIAKGVNAGRTFGAGPGANSVVPAEIINFDPTLYSFGGGRSDKEDDKTKGSFVITSTQELPPRR